MARFRRSGTNWEGRPWRTPPSLNALLDRIEADFPKGNTSQDGTVASRGHDQANPNSDHRPDTKGIVRAVDVWQPDIPTGDLFAEYLRAAKDRRIKYVIWNRRMFASYDLRTRKAWEWGSYSGSNPHNKHAHVSTETRYDTDHRPWPPILKPEETDEMLPLKLGDGTGDRAHKIEDVRYLQELLNRAGARLDLDGIYGPRTVEAVAQYTQPTGNPAGQRGEWCGGRQLGNLTARITGGVSASDVKGMIATTKLSP